MYAKVVVNAADALAHDVRRFSEKDAEVRACMAAGRRLYVKAELVNVRQGGGQRS